MKTVSTMVAVFLICGIPAVTRGQGQANGPLDKDFLVKAASANNAEIEIAKLADSRAQSNQVKEYAKTLQKDHKAAYDKLGSLFQTRKFGVAAGMEQDTKDTIKHLSSLQGAAFDQAFVQHMVQDHKKAVAMFENEARNGKEADIRDYAKTLLPDLRKHLSKAEELFKIGGR